MASSSSTAIFVLFLLSATLVLPSQALPDNLISIKGLQVAGHLYCSVDGNTCPTCSGLGGVNVTITCNNGTTSLGNLLTDTSGFIDGVVDFVDGILFQQSLFPCYATVQLPVANCTLFPSSTGILVAPVYFLGTVIYGILGLLAKTSVGAFAYVYVTL